MMNCNLPASALLKSIRHCARLMRSMPNSSARDGLRYSRPNAKINTEILPTRRSELTMQVEQCKNVRKSVF
jgi:hypothetical protein